MQITQKFYKNKDSGYLSGLVQFNSSIPLIKNDINSKKLSTPKLSLKIAPKHTKNNRNNDNPISTDNIYSLNRYSEKDTIEEEFH